MIALFRFWPLQPEPCTQILRTCFLLLYTHRTHCCIAGCTIHTSQVCCPTSCKPPHKGSAHSSTSPSPAAALPAKARTLPAPPSGRKHLDSGSIVALAALEAWHPPTATHQSPHPLPPWPGVAPRSSLHQIQGQARERRSLGPALLPCPSTSKLFDDSRRNKTNRRRRQTYATRREHPRHLHHNPETQGQSNVPCLRPRQYPQSACLIFQAPRRCLLFAITWYGPPYPRPTVPPWTSRKSSYHASLDPSPSSCAERFVRPSTS